MLSFVINHWFGFKLLPKLILKSTAIFKLIVGIHDVFF